LPPRAGFDGGPFCVGEGLHDPGSPEDLHGGGGEVFDRPIDRHGLGTIAGRTVAPGHPKHLLEQVTR